MFTLVQNIGAGYAKILRPGDQKRFHEDFVGEFETIEEAEEAYEQLRGKPIFAVFWNNGAADGYVSQEDNLSGNWRGSRDGHYTCVAEQENQADADKVLASLKNRSR
jgi:hypothetical protein